MPSTSNGAAGAQMRHIVPLPGKPPHAALMQFTSSVFFKIDIDVPEELQPPSIDALWTANLADDLVVHGNYAGSGNQPAWDDPSLIDLL